VNVQPLNPEPLNGYHVFLLYQSRHLGYYKKEVTIEVHGSRVHGSGLETDED